MVKMASWIRDGKIVWPTCNECGCRLETSHSKERIALTHFGDDPEKDARGHMCKLVNATTILINTDYQGVV